MTAELVDGRAIDSQTAAELADLSEAIKSADSPHLDELPAEQLRLNLKYSWDNRGVENLVLARVDGVLAGYAELDLPIWDNVAMLYAEMGVHPDHRDSDVGDQMLVLTRAVMAAQSRTLLLANAWAGSDLEAFWLGHGLERGSLAAQRRLVVADLDWPRLDALHADSLAASEAYEVIEVPHPVPADLVDGMVDLQRAMNDAPTDNLALEDHLWNEQRLRDHEEAYASRRIRDLALAARHRESGELAGFTAVAVEHGRPHLGFQEDTAVVSAHRGHRLGLRLKVEMLRLLREREPQIVQIDTWNAASNAHMIAVNEAIGCVLVAEGAEFQRDFAANPM